MDSTGAFRERVAAGPPILLDGALGTEIERRGIPAGLPLWSSHALLEAPDAVVAIHREQAAAGAEVLTAATFRTQRRSLARAGLGERGEELTRRAVELARHAAEASGRRIWVAGSASPLEDCYRPDLVPEAAACEREHREHADNLARAGVDLIAVETLGSVREAVAAANAAAATGLPFWVSFTCGENGRLLSGEGLSGALERVGASGPLLVAVNCVPPSTVARCLSVLAGSGRPFGVYPNLGAPLPNGVGRTHDCSPDQLADLARGWCGAGARLIGGCCGTRPEHVRALAAVLASASAHP